MQPLKLLNSEQAWKKQQLAKVQPGLFSAFCLLICFTLRREIFCVGKVALFSWSLINHFCRHLKAFGALWKCCWNSFPVSGQAPSWQLWSWCPVLPHSAGLPPSASLEQISTEQPDLSIKWTHFSACHELNLSPLQSECTLREMTEGRAESAAVVMHRLWCSCSQCNCLHYKAIIRV